MTWLAVVFAAAGAVTTALSTAVQHHAASTTTLPAQAEGPWALVTRLVRQPAWLGALALGPLGFAWHVLALHHGPIALVQPIVIVGIVAALPLRAALSRARIPGRELRAATLTVAALAVFLLASAPQEAEQAVAQPTLAVATAACAAAAVTALVLAGSLRRPAARATVLGASSGVLFGLMAVLIEAGQQVVDHDGFTALLLSWITYATVACGVGGLVVNQWAYRAAPLAVSMPVLNVVNCVVTLAFGYAVFHEAVDHSAFAILVAALALVVIVRGLWVLSGADPHPPRRTSSMSSPEVPSAPGRAASEC